MEDEFTKKLEERYRSGEISRETYEEILQMHNEESQQMEKLPENLENNEKRDYKCAGSCTLPPGSYGNISSAGAIKIGGDIKADKLSSAGSLSSEGSVYAADFRSAGSAKINGNLEGNSISIAGSLKARNIRGDRIKVSGQVFCSTMRGGKITVEGGVNGEEINGDYFSLIIGGKSEVEKIEAQEIEIRGRRTILRKCTAYLMAKEIKGEKISLRCVTVDVVDGEEISVSDCKIGTLRGNKIKMGKNSKVEKVVRK